MRFLQVHGFYQEYLARFYQDNPKLAFESYQVQIAELLKDGYSASHLFAPYMGTLGYDSEVVFYDCKQAQFQWLHERVPGSAVSANWTDEIVILQIAASSPDILYLPGLKQFDSSFIRKLPKRPSLVIGWYGVDIDERTDLTEFDCIFSSASKILTQAKMAGAKDAVRFYPGMPAWISDAVAGVPKTVDLSFVGSWGPAHRNRNFLLTRIAAELPQVKECSIAYHLLPSIPLDSSVLTFFRPPLWGMPMYQLLKESRIVFNADIDGFAGETGNMRLFEATSVGSFVLTEYKENIGQSFVPGEEVETYRNDSELIEKICYYLDHPAERERIARKGHERCLREYSMEKRAQYLDSIIKKKLFSETFQDEDPYDTAYRWGWNTPALRQLVHLCYKTPDLVDNARRFAVSEGFKEVVSLLISLGKPPRKDINVLDLGCGNGVGTYALARAGYSVTGIDSSCGELAGLQAAAKINGLDGAAFSLVHSTGESLDFPNEQFDIIWMREVLHHIKALNSFMKEAARVLKPGGIICCLREHVIWNESQREHFFRTHPFYHITKDEGCYYLEEYLDAFSAAHFDVVNVLGPTDSIINSYPKQHQTNAGFDIDSARRRQEGDDLFTFFAKKPAAAMLHPKERQRIESGDSILLESFHLEVSGAIEGQNYFRTGNGCMIGARVDVVSSSGRVDIGDNVYISPGTRMFCAEEISFGSDILVAWGCTIMDHDSYPLDAEARKSVVRNKIEMLRHGNRDWDKPDLAKAVTGKIRIEDNVWIGMNSAILKGVTIGEGAVVGACSVVTSDVEPWSVVIGNPARRII